MEQRQLTHLTRAWPLRLGAIAWIVGPVQFFLADLLVPLAWPKPYSWADNNISDLGNVTCRFWEDSERPRYICSPLHTVMNTSMVTLGVLMIAGTILTAVFWGRGGLSNTARALLFVHGAACMLVGFVPADVDENLHVLGALLIMGVGNIGLLLAGFVHPPRPVARLRVFTLAAAGAALVAAWLHFSRNDIGIGLGGLERIAAFSLMGWAVIAGIHILVRARGPQPPRLATSTAGPR